MRKRRQKQIRYNILTILAIAVMVLAGFMMVRSLRGSSSQARSAAVMGEKGAAAGETSGEGSFAKESCHLSKVTGISYVERSGIAFQIEEDTAITAGDVIETKADAALILESDHASMSIAEETELKLASETEEHTWEMTKGEVLLQQRSETAEADKTADDSKSDENGGTAGSDEAAKTVDTPTAVAGILRMQDVTITPVLKDSSSDSASESEVLYDLSLQQNTAVLMVLSGEVQITSAKEKGNLNFTVDVGQRCDFFFFEASKEREQKGSSDDVKVYGDEKITAEVTTARVEDLDPFALAQILTLADSPKSATGSWCFTKEELQGIQTSRDDARKEELAALTAHEAQVIANGLNSDGTVQEDGSGSGGSGNSTTGGGSSTGKSNTGAANASATAAGSDKGSDSDKNSSSTQGTVTISISCSSILNNMDKLASGKNVYVPANGTILATCRVAYTDGETAFDILKKACEYAGVPLEYSYSGTYGTYYVEGINNLYEFDCGSKSGWTYSVNGWSPNYGSSSYKVKDGDSIVWSYTCN